MTDQEKVEKLLQAHALISEVSEASQPDGRALAWVKDAAWTTLKAARCFGADLVDSEMQKRIGKAKSA